MHQTILSLVFIVSAINGLLFYVRLAAAQAELDATMATLHEKQAKLADVEAQVGFSLCWVFTRERKPYFIQFALRHSHSS